MNKKYYTAIYARLSSKKDEEIYDKSKSISNQIRLIKDYIKDNNALNIDNEICIYKIYIDDGYSGTNFNRPGFTEMLIDLYKHCFNMIIVKDLSRIGRNLIETSRYIEEVFPKMNIRFISIMDKYDSITYSDDIKITIKNFINQMYSKDIKKKINTSLELRGKSTDLIGSIKYGFLKENNHLIIDPVASVIVKRIFKEVISGLSIKDITINLINDKVYTPIHYKMKVLEIKYKNEYLFKNPYNWNSNKVLSILHDKEYTGYGINYKNSKKKHEIIEIKNAHEAIISITEYEEAQKKIKSRNRDQTITGLYNKLIKCELCNKYLTFTRRVNKGNNYVCKSCHQSILERDITNILYEDFLSVVNSIKNENKEIKQRLINRVFKQYEDIVLINKEKYMLNNELKKTLEKYFKGLITVNELNMKTTIYNERLIPIENRINIFNKQDAIISEYESKFYAFLNKLMHTNQNKIDYIKQMIKECKINFETSKISIKYNKNI